MQQIFGGEMRRSTGGLGRLGDLPGLREALARLPVARTDQSTARPPGKQLGAGEVDLATLGCRHEINKGSFIHELDLDGQAAMWASPIAPAPRRAAAPPAPARTVEEIVALQNHQPAITTLRAARERLGWSQSLVAFEAGVSQGAVSRAERQPGTVSAELLAKIASALGLRPQEVDRG